MPVFSMATCRALDLLQRPSARSQRAIAAFMLAISLVRAVANGAITVAGAASGSPLAFSRVFATVLSVYIVVLWTGVALAWRRELLVLIFFVIHVVCMAAELVSSVVARPAWYALVPLVAFYWLCFAGTAAYVVVTSALRRRAQVALVPAGGSGRDAESAALAGLLDTFAELTFMMTPGFGAPYLALRRMAQGKAQ